MEIVILGNGFDLANGLPTSYTDFFKWEFEKIISECDEISKIKNDYFMYFEKQPRSHEIRTNRPESRLRIEVDTDCGRKTYEQLYEEINVIMDGMHKKRISFFDLYFILNKMRNNANWSDIENEIRIVVKHISEYSKNTAEDMLGIADDKREDNSKLREKIAMLFLRIYFQNCKLTDDKNSYETLMRELMLFENEFQVYIGEIAKKVNSTGDYQQIYIQNFNELTNENESRYILNFNYTNVTENICTPNSLPREHNLHGKYDNVIFFGIDQDECDVNSDEYTFSKTYRKIYEGTGAMILPEKKDRNVEQQKLIFYGHSLASADTSYFRSLFDLYDIYNQTFLIFKYSIYDEEQRDKIKKEVFHNITKLLMEYGQTMTNKDHGKNLLHKIILEGRLNIQEVKLKKIAYS
ncbi:MAG: bacteriophage abortive infection AbiH family protein [Butyrivibrio sp.]|jgi:hypothetical protein|nr:bacteriophage abortive infection AbiH family protein [Butyrivibrio sp.]